MTSGPLDDDRWSDALGPERSGDDGDRVGLAIAGLDEDVDRGEVAAAMVRERIPFSWDATGLWVDVAHESIARRVIEDVSGRPPSVVSPSSRRGLVRAVVVVAVAIVVLGVGLAMGVGREPARDRVADDDVVAVGAILAISQVEAACVVDVLVDEGVAPDDVVAEVRVARSAAFDLARESCVIDATPSDHDDGPAV